MQVAATYSISAGIVGWRMPATYICRDHYTYVLLYVALFFSSAPTDDCGGKVLYIAAAVLMVLVHQLVLEVTPPWYLVLVHPGAVPSMYIVDVALRVRTYFSHTSILVYFLVFRQRVQQQQQ